MGVRRTEGEPHDRLTRLAAAMTDALDHHPEAAGDEKAIVMLDDGRRGGIHMHGYDDDLDAVAALFTHLQAILEANGKTMQIHALPGRG